MSNELKKGLRVKYVKKGGRKGWTGTVTDVSGDYYDVEYDNGVCQKYHTTSYSSDGKEWRSACSGYLQGYIHPLTDDEGCSGHPINKESFLVVNRHTGKLLCNEESLSEAELMASQYAQDSSEMHSFVVYQPVAEFKKAKPIIEVVRNLFGGK